MFKKVICVLIICAIFVSISPAVVAVNTPVKPTIEEILSEYHQAAFQEQNADKQTADSTYSPRSNSKTLEQETVDTLNAAGYEAYNITSTNYETLESELDIDFDELGLDPNYSHIIVISGEDSENNSVNSNPSTRAIVPTPDPGGDGSFTFTYNGITYRMRYVTVTSKENPHYAESSPHNLLENYSDSFLDRFLEAGITAYLDSLNKYVPFGTLLSIIGISDYINRYRTANSSLTYHAATQWVRTYIQVWSDSYEEWHNASCAEFVDMESKISGYLYDTRSADFLDVDELQVNKREYSSNYYNYTQRKIDAVLGYNSFTIRYDIVGDIRYNHNNTLVAYHSENF